jgi:hypothetical protein
MRNQRKEEASRKKEPKNLGAKHDVKILAHRACMTSPIAKGMANVYLA